MKKMVKRCIFYSFVYTGNSTFLKEDVNDLFNAASYLDMPVLIKFIEKENPVRMALLT